jgi:hypothetical protein
MLGLMPAGRCELGYLAAVRIGVAMAIGSVAASDVGCRSRTTSADSPSVAAPASAGCQKDADCKGDRICEDGRCKSVTVAAPETAPSSSPVSAAPPTVPPRVFPPDSFALSVHGWNATIIQESGVDTSAAVMVGEVLPADAQEYCTRDSGGETVSHGGKLTLDRCIAKVLADQAGHKYGASADCIRKSIIDPNGSQFSIVDMEWFETGKGYPVWRRATDGHVLDGSSASGAPVLAGQFQALCPSFTRDFAR